jgi:hypothetical protein
MIHADDPQMVRRYRVNDAAALLGISTQAIRHRIRRGTLDSEKDESGVVWVLLEPETVSANDPSAYPEDTPEDSPRDNSLLELVEVLREQLAAAEERERRSDERERELRRIIAGLVQRVPELPSPDDLPNSPEDAPRNVRSDEQGSSESASKSATNGGGGERSDSRRERSWWRAFFGF